MKEVNIYVKCSNKSTRKRDGYIAYVLELITSKKPATLHNFEKVEQMTTNKAEIVAIIKALKRMTEKCSITIYTDSLYVKNSLVNKWVDGWQRKNWVNGKGEPIANAEEWQELLELLKVHQYALVHGFKHEYASWMELELSKRVFDDKR